MPCFSTWETTPSLVVGIFMVNRHKKRYQEEPKAHDKRQHNSLCSRILLMVTGLNQVLLDSNTSSACTVP